MKLIKNILGVLFIGITASCSTYQPGIVTEPDDRYYSLRDARSEQRTARKLTNSQSSAFADPSSAPANQDESYQRITDPSDFSRNDGGTTIINNYNNGFDMDNYYDFMFASRIRRFHRNNIGFGYYDPFFTNSYFYNRNPFMFGNSIYSSYGFFNPYVPWGFNNWGGGPGLNIGWNSFSGFHMNFNLGWGNPYMAFNNPWRWNNFGFNPWGSPFGYNPWAYNPWGGWNSFNNGYAMGYSNALMYNNMMSNPMYYNSFDNNTYNNTTINNSTVNNNYGVNSTPSAGGSSWKSASDLNSTFSQEFGQSSSAMHTSNAKATSANTTPVKGSSNATMSPANAASGKGSSNATMSPASSKDNQGKGNGSAQISSQNGNELKGTSTQIQSANVNQVKGSESTQVQSVNNETKGGSATQIQSASTNIKGQDQSKATPAINSATVNSQSGKQDLISQGKPSSVVSNYTSAPVKGSQAIQDNSPAINRPSNITPQQIKTPSSSQIKGATGINNAQSRKAEPYMPKYDYNSGVRSNDLNSAGTRAKGQVPSRSQDIKGSQSSPADKYQRYQTPQRSNPAQNYQRYQAPQQSSPAQNNQRYQAPKQNSPSQNYQRFQAPQQSSPSQNNQRYQAPKQSSPSKNNQRYQAPKQNSPSQRYQAPNNSAPSRNYQAPRSNSPRNSYQAPRSSSPRNSYQAPRSSSPRNSYSAPSRSSTPKSNFSSPSRSNSNRSISSPSRSSSPKMNSSSPSRSSGSGSRSISSPKRR